MFFAWQKFAPMLFNSEGFFFFFVVVFILYYLLPHPRRWVLLLVASYYFYAQWNAAYLALILFSTLVDFWAGKKMAALPEQSARRPYLYLSLLSNLGLLFTFKYANFLGDSINELIGGEAPFVPHIELLLPVGISFYTFQTLSYTLEIYYGRLQPSMHLGKFGLFVSFFPQLVAGPIERSGHLLPQFERKVTFDYERVAHGLHLVLWGLFKKVVVADRLALFVNEVYGHPDQYAGLSIVLATLAFAFQIYCDFSGYSDMAIGLARMLGFDLMQNFRQPYLATSLADYWRRWHISLSTWFRDYVYIPLGGNRVVKWRWYYNLFLTFLVSGLWHGAAWTFVIWGAIHGLILVVEQMTGISGEKGKRFTLGVRLFRMGYTFVVVCVAWIFFRAACVSDAFALIGQVWEPTKEPLSWRMMGNQPLELMFALAGVLFVCGADIFVELRGKNQDIRHYPLGLRWVWYMVLLSGIAFLGVFEDQAFIYFQF
ncbi:MAG: MBOAT family O-acyltransferase [Bacteroidota bacterium]